MTDFINSFAGSVKKLNFDILVYNATDNSCYSVNKGIAYEASLPEPLKAHVDDDKCYCCYFSSAEKMMVVYFVRFLMKKQKYVIILQDTKQRVRLNRLIAVLISPIFQEQDSVSVELKDAQITELSQKLEAKQAELDKKDEVDLFNKTLWNREKMVLTEETERLKKEVEANLWNSHDAGELQKLKEAVKTLTGIEDKLTAANFDIENLKDENDDLKREVVTYKAKLETATKEPSDLEGVIEGLELKLSALDKEKRRLEEALKERETFKITHTTEEENTINDSDHIRKLQLLVDELQNENEGLKRRNRESSKNTDADNSEEGLSSSDAEFNELVESLQNEISDLEHQNSELKSKLHLSATAPSEEYERVRKENITQKAEISALQAELATHKHNISTLEEKHSNFIEDINSKERQLMDKASEYSKHRAELAKLEQALEAQNIKYRDQANMVMGLTKTLDDTKREFASKKEQFNNADRVIQLERKRTIDAEKHIAVSEERANVAKKEKERLLEVLNGIPIPLFTIAQDNKVLFINKAMLALKGIAVASQVAGHECHKAIFNSDTPCAWCMLEQVRENEESMRVNITSSGEGTQRNLEATFFPVFDAEGTLLEVAELIVDKTELFDLSENLDRLKDKMRLLKAARVDEVNQLNNLKVSYDEMSAEHKKVLARNGKMTKVIERLISEDKARELMDARAELMELRNKLLRSADTIKNYRYQLDEQQIKYSNLNRRTFLQMERVFNLIKGKGQIKGEETVTILTFLVRELERVKKQFVEDNKHNKQQANADTTPSATEEGTVESVEGQKLKEKVSKKEEEAKAEIEAEIEQAAKESVKEASKGVDISELEMRR